MKLLRYIRHELATTFHLLISTLLCDENFNLKHFTLAWCIVSDSQNIYSQRPVNGMLNTNLRWMASESIALRCMQQLDVKFI